MAYSLTKKGQSKVKLLANEHDLLAHKKRFVKNVMNSGKMILILTSGVSTLRRILLFKTVSFKTSPRIIFRQC